LIELEALTIEFATAEGQFVALRDWSFAVAAGSTLALVGESGSGKTTAALAALGYLARNASRTAGTVSVLGQDVLSLPEDAVLELRRSAMGYVPQNPGSSLNPVRRVGKQIREVAGAASESEIAEMLDRVSLPPALARRYPHQLSGGQQQRVAIAMALANRPKVLVLDEPTTGLDVRTQAEVLALIRQLADEGLAVLYVTHDLAAAAVVADRLVVAYAGEIFEEGRLAEIYARPRHPYTSALLVAMPTVATRSELHGIAGSMLDGNQRSDCCVFHNRCSFAVDACRETRPTLDWTQGGVVRCLRAGELALGGVRESSGAAQLEAATVADPALLAIEGVSVRYRRSDPFEAWAVRDVSLSVSEGQTLALVGESGSGKTSLARAIAGLVAPVSGAIALRGAALPPTVRMRSRKQVRHIQYVFQNSSLALNPRHSVARILSRPLEVFFGCAGAEAEARVVELLELVRLPRRVLSLRPGRLSGGEQQRVAIARALAAEPDLIVCDEIVSALDVSVQAAIVDLLGDLQARMSTTCLFISHDLGVVRSIAHQTAVLKLGELVEWADTEQVFEKPQHPYTQMLLAHVPDLVGDGEISLHHGTE
jgi:peptide/nickel transport system ATP-binding protein